MVDCGSSGCFCLDTLVAVFNQINIDKDQCTSIHSRPFKWNGYMRERERERVRTGFAFPSTLFLQYFQCVLTSIQPFCMHFTWNDVIRTVFPFFEISNWFNFHVFAKQLSMNAIKSTECSVCMYICVCLCARSWKYASIKQMYYFV